MPEWITVRTPEHARVATSRAPFDPQITDSLVRAARTVRRNTPRSARSSKSVYVVLLDLGSNLWGLYVGRTGHSPEERFLRHKRGHKASKWVRKYGIGLLPALYRHLNPMDYEDAVHAEVRLAEALAATGILVKQG
jgi:hypothetical protein